MQPLEIIGAVAAARLREIIAADGTRALFGIMGLSPAVTSVMARHLAAIPNVGKVEVFVHPSLEDGDTGLASVSTRTATWHRNHPTPGVRATVFSVPAVQIRAIEQSLGHVVRIDEAWLRERPVDWAEVALSHALPETRASFAEMLDGLLASDLVVTAPLLARFCSRVAETMKAGSMLENAVGESLPALRLPRNPVGGKQNLTADAAAARAFFQRMRAEAQPFLYRRTREGETLASGDLRRKLDELEAAQAISHENAERIGALCDDRNVRDGQWSAAQAEAAEIPWDQLSAVFTQTKRTEKPTFGSDTQRLFDQEYRNTLTKEEKEFLDGLKTDVATPGPKIDQFWETHRDRLKSNPPLYRRWEKLIFKKPIEVEDLGEGLLRLVERVCSEADIGEDARVQIRLRGSDQASFWANPKLRHQLLYLRDRYRGLDGLLAPEIAFDLGLCWSSKWEDQSSDGQSGTNSIEFEAFLVDKADLADAKGGKLKSAAARAQMLWRPPSDAVAYSLPSDLRHVRPADVENAHLLTGKVAENRRARGGATGIDLEDAGTLVDAFGRSSGSLANPERAENHVGRRFDQLLAELESDTVVNAEGALAIRAAMSAFRSAYTKAVGALIDGPGLASPSLVSQAERFGNLFDALREHAPSESGLRELVSPLLDIGCIEVEGRRPAAIVAAWHPLRLAEIGAKAAQLAAAAKAVVRSSVERRTGARDFLESRVRTLAGTYYADLGRSGGARPRLLAQTQRVLDCGMLEEAEGEGVRNIGEEGAKEAVEALQRISKEYLELRPHERSNFSITLLGAESDDIPVLLAKSLDRLVDENPDIRCDLVATHDDPLRLRELYESQNRRMAADLDTSAASGLSRSFLSRLRVSLVGPDRLVPAEGGKASDIVLLQDVIARSAMVRWMEAEVQTDSPSIADHVPTARSKRLPFRKRSVESGLFLTSPVQPAAVVSWSNALHDVVVKQNTTPAGPWLPLRWAEFDDTGVSDVLRRAHSLANWVVTFDRIADRRLIVQDDRRIIRYFSTPNSAHNVIVSAEVTTSDLGDRLKGDLTQLLPNATPDERAAVLKRLHKTAARLSGAVVMRAAQWRNYAQELLGLVLAERRLEGLLEADGEHATALFFLDDNRQWLDLKGEMADILAVAFSAVDDRPKIRVVVAEAKYCTAANVPAHRATSLRQTEATYTELARRLLQPETSLDPTIWRDRIADMLLEQMDPFDVVGGINQSDWIEALRQQTVPIEVSAHSMVFSHDLPGVHADKAILPDEGLPPEDRRPLAQWVHGRSEVVELLLGLGRGDPPPSLPLPADWPAGGAAPRSPESGDSTPHGGQSHDPKAVAEQNESTTVAADGEASNDVSDQTVTSGSLANAGPLAARAEGEPTPPGESAELPADGSPSDRPLANGPAANEGAAHLGTGTGQIGARKADGPVVHSGTAQDRRAEVDPAATDSRPEVPIGEAALTAATEEGWEPPILAALRRMSHAESQAAGEAWLEQKVHDLQNALQAEGMDAPIVESRLTPNSGLVYVGARTLTIAWLERRQTDLLTKHRIEIVRISPMPGSIAIAIRRPQRSVLHLADAWLRRNPSVGPGPEERFAPVVGEKEDDGALLHLPLAGPFAGQERAAPHALISGNTGSGKGILVTNLMLDLCALNAPRDIDLYLIDPKRGVDYGWARRLPHLRRGIVADQPEAIALLEELVAEMEERYDLISDRGFRNIDQYNLRVAAAERLPRVVIFFDEVANWMQDDGFKKEVESLLNKIATKARAAGLHLFMVYQRADVQVMTMQLRTNLGNRLILRLPDEGSSKIALGEKGAERLLGKGHVIAKLDSDEKIYTQVPFIGDEEVEDLVDAIAAAWGGLDPRSD